MFREIGRRSGRMLGEARAAGILLETKVREEIRTERAALARRLIEARRDSGVAERELEAEREEAGSVMAQRRSLREERARYADRFAPVKGVLYMFFSALLILADASILGLVISELLGQPWRIQGPTGGEIQFSQVLLTQPWQAFRQFPDLFCLTFAVLLVSFFVKPWLDQFRARDIARRAGEEESGASRREYRIWTVLLFTVLLCLIVLAMARFAASGGGASDSRGIGTLARVTAALLGITFPLVSAAFFVAGYDCLSRIVRSLRLRRQSARSRRRLSKLEGRRDRARSRLEKIEAAREELEGPEVVQQRLAAARIEFHEGYREGLRELVDESGDGRLWRRVKPLAIGAAVASARFEAETHA